MLLHPFPRPTTMFSPPKSTILIAALLISSAHAQVTFRRRRPSIGRIIAGCVVGGIAAIFFICLLMMILRRRRLARRTLGTVDGQYQPPSQKPLFGGLLGRNNGNNGAFNNQNYMNGSAAHPQQSFGHNGMPHQGQQGPYNSEYPNSNAPAAPPAYGNDKQNVNGNTVYAPPPVSHSGANNGQQHFAPPPGPPPPAHTTGQDSSFVGGFRH
ncbi:hypothetical protein D9619_006922 [Psilocybe cf. subviscida]|uniref:Uncharacterized protein n=1 Tax=Psilocybe cf. subviscida TaxID=2480587 RepID=A0A8H5B3G8_9AGAR|nr:hypothetical protein D9619_006922 [Psilocybe cf. subviscida]